MALGDTLVGKGLITTDQLNKGLDAQKSSPGKKIGEILVEMGFIKKEDIDKALG